MLSKALRIYPPTEYQDFLPKVILSSTLKDSENQTNQRLNVKQNNTISKNAFLESQSYGQNLVTTILLATLRIN